MTYLALLLDPIRKVISTLATASAPTPLRGAFLALAVAAAAILTATPGQAIPDDGECMLMGESTDENGTFQCVVCEIEGTEHCYAVCSNKTGAGFECEGWF